MRLCTSCVAIWLFIIPLTLRGKYGFFIHFSSEKQGGGWVGPVDYGFGAGVAAQAGRPFTSRYLAVSDPRLTMAAKNAGLPLQETRDPVTSTASPALNWMGCFSTNSTGPKWTG